MKYITNTIKPFAFLLAYCCGAEAQTTGENLYVWSDSDVVYKTEAASVDSVTLEDGKTAVSLYNKNGLLYSTQYQTIDSIAFGAIDSRPGEYITATLEKATSSPILSIGVEFDPHFFSQNVTRNDGVKAEDWDRIVVPRVKKLKPDRFRVMMFPNWWEPVNDNDDPNVADMDKFTFDSEEMQSVYKELDLAQENGIGVTLVVWGCINNGHFLCDERSHTIYPGWIAGTDKYEEFAENFSTLVKYLREVKGYTCVDQVTPFNEPDGILGDYGRLMELYNYVKLVKAMDTKFKADGIRNDVVFNLSDNTDGSPQYLKECASAFSSKNNRITNYILNSHCYKFNYDTPNSTFKEWEKNNLIAIRGKTTHFVGEFGFPGYGAARQYGIDTYTRGVQLVRAVLNYLNAGACGVSYWRLIDQYIDRYDSYDKMQQLGLWKYVKSGYVSDTAVYESIKEDYEVRPQYHAYGLLMRFVCKGDTVYPLELGDEHIAGSTFHSVEGKWTYVLSNATYTDRLIQIENAIPGAEGRYDVYKYIEGKLPEGDDLIEASETVGTQANSLKLLLPRWSVMALVQR